MFWKSPPLQSKQTQSVFYLKNSRISDNSTEIDRSFKLGNSFELENSIINSHSIAKSNKITENIATFERNNKGGIERQGRTDEIKRKFLNKFLINRMLNIRQALKQMQSIPVKIFTSNASFKIAKQILMKTKVNVEISVLRTLFFSHQNKSNNNCKLKCISGENVFVFPTPNQVNDAAKQEEVLTNQKLGLNLLAQVFSVPVRWALELLKKHQREETAVLRYFNKLCANYEISREQAFLKMKQLPNKVATGKLKFQLISKQLKIITTILTNKYSSLLLHAIQRLKQRSEKQRLLYGIAARQIVTFARLRKGQCMREWMYMSRGKRVKKEEEVCEEKKLALSRIVLRNYLKLFMEIARRLSTFEVVARRIGCYSKINDQKSFWRLLLHAANNKQKQIKT